MGMQTITNPQYASPAAASSPSVAAAGTAWANTAWVQIAGSTDVVWILTHIIVWTVANIAGTNFDWEIDIGTGGVGSEVVLTTVCGCHRAQGNSIYTMPLRLPIPVDNLNGRHAFRIRIGNTRTDVWNVALSYIKNPIAGTLTITSKPGKVWPPAANLITCTAGASWISGAWVQLVASVAVDSVVTAAMIRLGSTTQAEVDIGVGGAGSEVVVTTIRVGSNIQCSPAVFELPNPLDKFPAGSRIAIRARANTAATVAGVKLMYYEKPL